MTEGQKREWEKFKVDLFLPAVNGWLKDEYKSYMVFSARDEVLEIGERMKIYNSLLVLVCFSKDKFKLVSSTIFFVFCEHYSKLLL